MKTANILFAAVILAGCTDTSVMTYEQLVKYPVQCAKADEQLKELRKVQAIKNFDSDPDNLNEDDRAYNSRLKATIWWFAYSCGKS